MDSGLFGEESYDSPLDIAFLSDTFERVKWKMEDWEKGPQLELLGSASQEMREKIVELKTTWIEAAIELEERQNRVDKEKFFQICAKAVRSSKEELFRGFPKEVTQRALVNLLSRPWFQRAWVIQEFVVARVPLMYCGERLVPWLSILATFLFSFEESNVRWSGVIPAPQRMDFYQGLSLVIEMHSLWQKC
jgi:hypothetical protein